MNVVSQFIIYLSHFRPFRRKVKQNSAGGLLQAIILIILKDNTEISDFLLTDLSAKTALILFKPLNTEHKYENYITNILTKRQITGAGLTNSYNKLSN